MTMRRLALSNKKIRNIPRRLKALAAWACRFEGYFPYDLSLAQKYSNWKIPVVTTLVEGKQATPAIRKECAQQMINAAHRMLQARPENTIDCRVVAAICLPDMFSSEICIYTDLEYHRGQIPSLDSEHCRTDKSLAAEWGLTLADKVKERGLRYTYKDTDGRPYEIERWYFGEVD
jgi:hypothetical protein